MTAQAPDTAGASARFEAVLRRQGRVSLQYAVGTGLLVICGFWFQSPWPGLAIWAVFVAWLGLRYRALAGQRRVLAVSGDAAKGAAS